MDGSAQTLGFCHSRQARSGGARQYEVMTVRILTVCTGNICRSPYAERVLAHRLEAVRPGVFEVTSAGTGALVGEGVDPGSGRHLDSRGIRHDDFAARQLSERILDEVDLVVPLAVEHRKLVLSYAPRLLKRAYTLKELARLIDSAGQGQPWAERLAGLETPEERWKAIPQHLARERGRTRVEPGGDDVADPYRQSADKFDVMAEEVDAAVERIVALEASFA
jgi:protein-tyrosine phosphatase